MLTKCSGARTIRKYGCATFFKLKASKNKGVSMKALNIHGTLMQETDINSTNLILDISNYQAGNYILQSGRYIERFIKISE
mgnify:CR=1 FL=1